eukprot:s380_g24.t1
MPLLPQSSVFGWKGAFGGLLPRLAMDESLEEAKKDYGKGTSKTIFDISGLALKWDDSSVVRQRMRNHLNLCIHYDSKTKKETNFEVAKNVKNLKANQAVMDPKLLEMLQDFGVIEKKEGLSQGMTDPDAEINKSHPLEDDVETPKETA